MLKIVKNAKIYYYNVTTNMNFFSENFSQIELQARANCNLRG